MTQESNIVWTITAALLVYFMHGGFGFYEAGMCRSKNTVDTLSHNLLILAVTVLVYWAAGFGLMFGPGNGFAGLSGFCTNLLTDVAAFPGIASHPVPLAVAFAFAMSFADTPATLIAGTGAERIRFSAVLLLTVLISGILFPIVGHWTLGGGWLAKLNVPIYDTGSGAVHLCGGCCALAVAVVLGPRLERQHADMEKSKEREQVSSMPLVFLGAFIMWLGFFGFNAGLSMTVNPSIGLVVVNSALGGAAGAVTGMAGAQLLTGKARLRTAIVGLLTANVAVTSPSAVVEPWAAVLIGCVAGFVAAASISIWAWLRIDDPTEYLTMNLVGGSLGLLAVGLLASPKILSAYEVRPTPRSGLFYGGGWSQSLSQLLGWVAIVGFVLPSALAACLLLRAVGGLRSSASEEERGSDKSTHGERAYEQSQ